MSWIKGLLSIYAVFHVALIVTLANGPSILGRLNPDWMIDYANQLGINQVWNFFSPDPSHINYINYVIYFDDEEPAPASAGDSTEAETEPREPVEGYLPEQIKKVELNSSKRRMLHAVRYMSLDETRTEKLMAPWLCKKFPGASYVKLKHILEVLPNLDRASLNPEGPLENLIEIRPYRVVEFSCKTQELPNE